MGLQVNKFEQVSSDGHQMSLVGAWEGGPCQMLGEQGQGVWGLMSGEGAGPEV